MKRKHRELKRDKDGYSYAFDGVNAKNLVSVPPPPGFPKPDEIAKMLRTEKITILLDGPVVEYFKKAAAKNKVSYQKMIREVLRRYTALQQTNGKAA